MKACLNYLRYVLRHKWLVFIECYKLGIPFLGLLHDWSKFLPSEVIKYVRTLYNPNGTQKRKDDNFYLSLGTALTHHFRCNKHHWQYYLLVQGANSIISLDIPMRYRKEMLADWHGMGMAISGKRETSSWYSNNKDKMLLHPETREWIERQLGI